MPDSEALSQDASLLFDTVREAGDLALALRRRGVNHWSKSDGSAVSDGDLAVDALLRDRLMTARPAYGWLSEETPDSAARLACSTIFIADPIDGTRNYIRDGAEWCVGVALVHQGHVIASAVYRPAVPEFYAAVQGRGTTLNQQPLRVSEGAALAGSTVSGPRRAVAHLQSLGMAPAPQQDLPLLTRLAFVAAGRFDAAVSLGPKNDWDLAAGDLLVREAGGVVSGTQGEGYIYNRRETWQQGLIACGPARHPALVQALTGL